MVSHLYRHGSSPDSLQRLADLITHQQIRDLQCIIEQVDLRCDLIVELPRELSSMILQYLPLYQVFQARRVSRLWHSVLTSSGILEDVLRSWQLASPSLLRIPPGLSVEAIISLKAEHMDAYRTGNPFCMASGRVKFARGQALNERVAYSASVLAWIDGSDRRECHCLNFSTGMQKTFMTEERLTMTHIATSASMVTATSPGGRCIVWNFRNEEQVSFKLPSAQIKKLLLSGETLAIVFTPKSSGRGSQIKVFTWRYGDPHPNYFSLSLQIRKPECSYETKVMFDDQGQSILIFERICDRRFSETQSVHSIRASLSGEVRAQCSLEGLSMDGHWDYVNNINPVQARRFATIWSAMTWPLIPDITVDSTSFEVKSICYDFTMNELRLDTRRINVPLVSEKLAYSFWEDVAYVWRHDPLNPTTLNIVDLRRSTCTTAFMAKTNMWSSYFVGDRDISATRPNYDLSDLVLGDEIFHIRVFQDRFMVWCFDKNIDLKHQDIGYKDERKASFEERLRQRVEYQRLKPTIL